jgi:hypothetical protein
VNSGSRYEKAYFLLTRDLTGASDIITTVIGKDYYHFYGTFDGGGHEITVNIKVSEGYAGLFGRATSATIKNLTVSGSISGTTAGGICAKFAESWIEARSSPIVPVVGSISNCHNRAKISGKDAGGICGNSERVTISDCSNSGEILAYGTLAYAGGISGSNSSNSGTILNCYNSGNIIVYGDERDYSTGRAGGICGANSGTIRHCFSANTKITCTSTEAEIGRIAGVHEGKIEDCHALSSMSLNGDIVRSADASSKEGSDATLSDFTTWRSTVFGHSAEMAAREEAKAAAAREAAAAERARLAAEKAAAAHASELERREQVESLIKELQEERRALKLDALSGGRR